jgi:hypothetical protein
MFYTCHYSKQFTCLPTCPNNIKNGGKIDITCILLFTQDVVETSVLQLVP